MNLQFGHIEAKENKAVLFLKGQIGKDINGDAFADEILKAALTTKNIDLYINTVGGSVIQGLSIITAVKLVQDNGVNLRLINSGVAYSMGGFILASGNKGTRFAMDYAMAMIHDPRVSGEVELSDNEKEMIEKHIDSVALIVSNASGQDIEAVKQTMKAEKYLSASEMQAMGIIDEVINTGKMINIAPAARYERMVASAEIEKQLLTKTQKKMNKLNALLMLNAEASEEAQVQAIAEIKAKADQLKDVQASLESEKSKVEKLEAKLQASEKEAKRSAAENLVSKAVEAGKITEEVKAIWIEDAMENMERTEQKLNAITIERGSVNDQLEGRAGAKNDDKAKAEAYAKLMDEPDKMEEMDAKTLDEMEAAYKRMNAAEIKVVE